MSILSFIKNWFFPPSTYVVKSGDTLSGIARAHGHGSDYMKVYNANRDQISNPDQIKPGQVLKIPKV